MRPVTGSERARSTPAPLGGDEVCEPNPNAAEFVGLRNYVDILSGEKGDFWLQFGNTIIWTAACVVFHYGLLHPVEPQGGQRDVREPVALVEDELPGEGGDEPGHRPGDDQQHPVQPSAAHPPVEEDREPEPEPG